MLLSGRAALGMAGTAVGLMAVGYAAVPLAGWGAAYVYALGLWLFVGAVVPAIIWIGSAIMVWLMKDGDR
jgi:hypothetical protein